MATYHCPTQQYHCPRLGALFPQKTRRASAALWGFPSFLSTNIPHLCRPIQIVIAAAIFLILYKIITYSCVFYPCHLVPRFRLPRFQSPRVSCSVLQLLSKAQVGPIPALLAGVNPLTPTVAIWVQL